MRFRTLRNAVAVVLLCAFLTACAAKPSASGATWAESAPQGGKSGRGDAHSGSGGPSQWEGVRFGGLL